MAAAQRVKLLVYDLSRGMASQMSEQFLGQRIDGIWHTGVEVFGNEYFFGGGIQCVRAGVFANQQGMPPVQVTRLIHCSNGTIAIISIHSTHFTSCACTSLSTVDT